MTNILATNEKALQNDFYKNYPPNDLMAKARVISAKQLNKITPAYKTNQNQKDINTIINTSVQEVLLQNSTTQSILDCAAKNWKALSN